MKDKRPRPLADYVTRALTRYFSDLNGEKPSNLYDLVIGQVERPLLQVIMRQAESNQSRAAQMLGINRNTLRKKLRQYGLEK